MKVPKIYALAESALTVEFGNSIDYTIHQQVLHLNDSLQQKTFPGFIESVPAYASLTIYYQPELSSFAFVKHHVESLYTGPINEKITERSQVTIPVCYDDEFGYDLEFIARSHGLSKEQVINIHQQQVYDVYMMGFLPGFAYMGSVDDAIATARKQTPRANVEEGSVGIAGKQTGI